MDEQTREVLELIAGELEKLRILREHELGVRVEDDEGSLWVRTADPGYQVVRYVLRDASGVRCL